MKIRSGILGIAFIALIGLVLLFLFLFRASLLVYAINSAIGDKTSLTNSCRAYRGVLKPSDAADPKASEVCAAHFYKSDPETALFFCASVTKKEDQRIINPCLQAAENALEPDLKSGDTEAAAEKYVQIAKTSLPFLTEEQIVLNADRIRNKPAVDSSTALLDKANNAFHRSEFESALNDVNAFWAQVNVAGIETILQAEVIETAENWFSAMDKDLKKGEYRFIEPQLRVIKALTSQASPDHPVHQAAQPYVMDLIERGKYSIDTQEYKKGLMFLNGIYGISQDAASKKQIDEALQAAYDNIASVDDGDLEALVNTLRDNRCLNISGPDSILFPLIGRTDSSSGSLENCIGTVKLPDDLLADTLGDVKYRAEMSTTSSNKTFLRDCEYSGGLVSHLYSADYRIAIVEIKTGKIMAETKLSGTNQECDIVHTFLNNAKEDEVFVYPPDDEIIRFLKKAAADLP